MIKTRLEVEDRETLEVVQDIAISALEIYKQHPDDPFFRKEMMYWLDQIQWLKDRIESCDYEEAERQRIKVLRSWIKE
jgi:hypothetical protein